MSQWDNVGSQFDRQEDHPPKGGSRPLLVQRLLEMACRTNSNTSSSLEKEEQEKLVQELLSLVQSLILGG